MAAQNVPVPDTTPEEEFDLFGPGPDPGPAPAASSAAASSNPFVSEAPASPTVPQASSSPTGGVQVGGSPSGGVTVGEGDQTALLVGLLRQSLQQNQQMMQQNQQLVATMLRRMDLEEERRNKAEEKVVETAEAAKKAAEAALTRDPFDPRAAASSVDPGDKVSGSSFGGSNRAEKYLPPLPLIDHHVMGKGRMKEVEGWHTFLETLSSWLALQEEAFVRELQLCVPVKTEILQTKLPSDTAARSSKLFYYLTQSLAKWERGLELLRSCSKRQGMSACGYEVVRTITSQYSIVSRMEAVYVRDSALKLFQSVGGIKRPTDLIRHLEDAFAKSESKLTNFPELKLSEADRCSVLLQSLSAEVRQYVVLHGKSDDWEALRKSLTYYEEQLRLCDLPGSARALSDVLCDYCGKKGHKAEQCWQKKRDEKAAAGGPGKGKGDHEKKGKGRGDQTPKGARTPRGSEKGRGDKGKGDKGKEKGKDKWKKGSKGPKKHKKGKDKGRSLTEPESEEESGGGATLMALRFSAPAGGRPSPRLSEVPVLSPSEKPPPADVASKPAGVGPNGPAQCEDPVSESMGSLGTRFAKQGDVNHVCKALEATAGDVWLVDSGATCHIVSTQHLSGFRVVKKHERTANLFNASGGSIVVSGVVDLEVHFGDVFLRLEEVLVAEVGFNVISPWTASERGWKTFLAKGGSRLYKGNKKSIKLMGAQRAWWAVSGSKKNPKRQPKGAVPMEIDSISEGPKPGRCAGTALPGPALTGSEAPPGILKNRRKEAEYEIEAPGAQNPLSGTPFSFLFRGFVSDFSGSGPSEAPVFRDEAPEVHEVSLGEPSLLRKEHELEVVEHDCAHEFSEVCSDFEFFPERPKAFRKFWHGVSMFELVRKPCSLNFGMLGLFGMIGMTLLLAAVFAFVAFGNQGDDGQFVAYERNGTSTAFGRDGTSTAFGRDCTSAAFGRGCSSVRAGWWYERGAYYAGSSDSARDWWSVLGSRTCGGRSLGERFVDFRHFSELCSSRGRTGGCIVASSSGAFTRSGSVRPFACCGGCCRSSAGSSDGARPGRRRLGALASPECCLFGGSGTGCCLFGGPGWSRCEAPASRDTIWKSSSCWCGPDSERVGGRSAEASVSTRARSPSTGGRGFGPAPSGGGRRTVASFITLLRTPEPFTGLRFTCFVSYRQKLPHPSGFGWRWQFGGPRGWSHWGQGEKSSSPARGIWGANTLCSSEASSVSGGGAEAASSAETAHRPGHDYGKRIGRMAFLVKDGQTGQKPEGVGIDFRRCYCCRGIFGRSTAAGGASKGRSVDERPSGRRQEEESSSRIPHIYWHPALSQESFESHRCLRWLPQWVPRIVAGTIFGHWAGEARWVHCLGRTGGMEIPGGFGRTPSPEIIGQKESEEPHGECYDGYLVADPESCSREAAASAAADADHACRGKLGLLFGGCVRSLGRVAARRGRGCRVDRYPPLPWDRDAVAARGYHQGVWDAGFAGSAVSRGWCCSSFGRNECRRRLFFEPSGRYSCGHTGDGTTHAGGHTGYDTAHAGGNRTEEPSEPGISYSPARYAGGEDAFGVGWFDGTIASRGAASTCFTTTSAAAIEESVCAASSRSFGSIKRANATGKGVYSPLAFGCSIFRAFGRHRFRNRNPTCRLRGRGRGRESGHGACQSRLVNSFDVCFLKKKRTLGEHVWHEGFEWHVLGMELGMNVSFDLCLLWKPR